MLWEGGFPAREGGFDGGDGVAATLLSANNGGGSEDVGKSGVCGCT